MGQTYYSLVLGVLAKRREEKIPARWYITIRELEEVYKINQAYDVIKKIKKNYALFAPYDINLRTNKLFKSYALKERIKNV